MAITLLLCCPAADAQTDSSGAIPLAAKITDIGAFSNVRYTNEHAYGYAVLLWRAGKCVFGLFESSEGLAGDSPIGELQSVRYDEKTRTLSFIAKLTTGLTSSNRSKGFEPSRDLFEFDGYLGAGNLTGVVGYSNQNNLDIKPKYHRVVLRASAEEAEFMHNATTYGEWREKWQPILRFRGPKW
jgi:hypothetical protein